MKLPYRLLNSSAEIFYESNTKGSMGQPVQSLQLVSKTMCRCDLRSQSKDIAPIEQTVQTARVYLQGSVNLNTSNWIRITSPSGIVLTGQVASVSQPGLLGHHTAATIIVRSPTPDIAT